MAVVGEFCGSWEEWKVSTPHFSTAVYIYAPNASFTMNGSGSSSLDDMTGASVTKSVQMNGNFNFHYDENLGRLDLNRGFIVTSWTEL